MVQELFQLAFIGPGGPEILVVMLVLLLMFGAKDAPRIFRKLNEIISQIRNAADGFKREVMYGDLADDSKHDEDHDYSEDFQEPEPEPEPEPEAPSDEEGDAGKA